MLGGRQLRLDQDGLCYDQVADCCEKFYELLIIVNVGYCCTIPVSISFIIKLLMFVSTKQISA
jgi:hypothetical protein